MLICHKHAHITYQSKRKVGDSCHETKSIFIMLILLFLQIVCFPIAGRKINTILAVCLEYPESDTPEMHFSLKNYPACSAIIILSVSYFE